MEEGSGDKWRICFEISRVRFLKIKKRTTEPLFDSRGLEKLGDEVGKRPSQEFYAATVSSGGSPVRPGFPPLCQSSGYQTSLGPRKGVPAPPRSGAGDLGRNTGIWHQDTSAWFKAISRPTVLPPETADRRPPRPSSLGATQLPPHDPSRVRAPVAPPLH